MNHGPVCLKKPEHKIISCFSPILRGHDEFQDAVI
jgi:hypothetical protein